jgi:hypothetical protein
LDRDRHQARGRRRLEMTAEQLVRAAVDPYRWKWIIVGLHNALTGLMALAVERSDLLGAMTDDYAKAWWAANKRGERTDKEPRLAPFMELFSRVQSPDRMHRYGHSKALIATTDQTEQMERLNRWRNDFLHWKPVGWNIEVRGYAEMIETCLGVADFLAFECGNVFQSGSDALTRRASAAVESCKGSLKEIRRAYQL